MKVLLIVATKEEISPFISPFLKNIEIKNNHINIVYENIDIDILITGLGSVNTTFFATKFIEKGSYNLILNAGICGSFKDEYKIGDVVNINKEIFGDIGYEDDNGFHSFIGSKMIKKNDFPYSNGELVNPYKFESVNNLPKVKGLTVNTVHGKDDTISQIKKLFNPDVETMEGAAVFYCALQYQIPFCQIRCVSNYVEKRDATKWNIPLAISNLNAELIIFFKSNLEWK